MKQDNTIKPLLLSIVIHISNIQFAIQICRLQYCSNLICLVLWLCSTLLELLNEKQHTSIQFDPDAERIINHSFDQEKESRREDEGDFKEYKKYKNREYNKTCESYGFHEQLAEFTKRVFLSLWQNPEKNISWKTDLNFHSPLFLTAASKSRPDKSSNSASLFIYLQIYLLFLTKLRHCSSKKHHGWSAKTSVEKKEPLCEGWHKGFYTIALYL